MLPHGEVCVSAHTPIPGVVSNLSMRRRVPTADLTRNWLCVKRDGREVPFDHSRIEKAVSACLSDVAIRCGGCPLDEPAEAVTARITRAVVNTLWAEKKNAPGVEDVQRRVIQQLYAEGLYEAAEEYQNYREARRKAREAETASVFGRRPHFMPFDYPEVERFKIAIQDSPWTATDIDFTGDTQDYRVYLNPAERSVISRSALAIAQIEVSVKRFWVRLGDRLGRPEFEQVGVVFGENEVRHADAYAKILTKLDLQKEFTRVTQVPAVRRRLEYLARAMRAGSGGTDRGFARTLVAFALLTENASLFTQFATIKSFSATTGRLQNIDNVVQATMKEEELHAEFGVWLVNLIKSERPEWFDGKFYDELYALCRDAVETEGMILDWIFEDGSVSAVSRASLDAFLRHRVNKGVAAVGGDPLYAVDADALAELTWFRDELAVPVVVDPFHKRTTNYAAPKVAANADNLF